MKVAIIMDDSTRIDYVCENYLTDVVPSEEFLGIKGYEGFYKNKSISFLYFQGRKESLILRTEDLLSFRDFDLIINIGWGYSIKEEAVPPGSLVFLNLVKSNLEYKELLRTEGLSKFYELDKKIEKRILDAAKKLDFPVSGVGCFSVVSEFSKGDSKENTNQPLIDSKAFFLYEMAAMHNRSAVCLYFVKSSSMEKKIDLQKDFLLDKLILLALETAIRCV